MRSIGWTQYGETIQWTGTEKMLRKGVRGRTAKDCLYIPEKATPPFSNTMTLNFSMAHPDSPKYMVPSPLWPATTPRCSYVRAMILWGEIHAQSAGQAEKLCAWYQTEALVSPPLSRTSVACFTVVGARCTEPIGQHQLRCSVSLHPRSPSLPASIDYDSPSLPLAYFGSPPPRTYHFTRPMRLMPVLTRPTNTTATIPTAPTA
ncbi:uncharacterized protein CYBJADRAFT_2342 [Cyberlindnera jadinii NRRL Y-1542]|uniref:Uncharacterized protein n=1 Tax=Cyberlindnera jadinii (strain ATCC 18201 / CBS 1600 / BCRC 20928 / JCM 3617 / NBRC 0987 / NRRL Y-1542) TaxID=983966 RepID=A0A1E4S8F2_CYBJN|nr:hypothetical protein CYBJADRAFT_2342 [Cyberlindnera jadinii NRRL Y-1542]ODV75743.1 hypothetical protein CYBJADRAFT_2342 [Cyberlindnera jadinii NRRL Y-1542]